MSACTGIPDLSCRRRCGPPLYPGWSLVASGSAWVWLEEREQVPLFVNAVQEVAMREVVDRVLVPTREQFPHRFLTSRFLSASKLPAMCYRHRLHVDIHVDGVV